MEGGNTRDGVQELEDALTSLSKAVDKFIDGEGQPLDEDLSNMLQTLDITPCKTPISEALEAAQDWATIEDTSDIVETLANDNQTAVIDELNARENGEE